MSRVVSWTSTKTERRDTSDVRPGGCWLGWCPKAHPEPPEVGVFDLVRPAAFRSRRLAVFHRFSFFPFFGASLRL